MKFTPVRIMSLIAVVALSFSLVVQRYVEHRRIEASLVLTDPGNKETLEAGFMALGGFRGILADVLWVRAIAQQDSGRYYELKLICDMIQQLQPTFTNIASFQSHNMAYNLAGKSESCDDKWYWIRSGIEVLERGLERNRRNHELWFVLGFTYFDRLGAQLNDKVTGQDCTPTILADLPMIDDLTDEQREKVFTHPELWKGRARPARLDETVRYAAYYFYKSLETKNDKFPLRVERIYGNCLDRLGHYRSNENVPPEQRKWDEWGSEDWWIEMMRRNAERTTREDRSLPEHLRMTMIAEMGVCDQKITAALADNKRDDAAKLQNELLDDYHRFQKYFPNGTETLPALVGIYRDAKKKK